MQCPACEQYFRYEYLTENEIEPNDEFECPACSVNLIYEIDEGTYFGAQHTTVQIVD
jgi:hypothetical protein